MRRLCRVSAWNPVVEAFVGELDLQALGFERMTPAATGRPAYHPSVLLKIYICGYLNRIASRRRLERECQRNIELMWLTGRLAPDFKTIADFRRNSGSAIRRACRQFIVLCRDLKLFSQAVVAIDGSKFKAVNSLARRLARLSMTPPGSSRSTGAIIPGNRPNVFPSFSHLTANRLRYLTHAFRYS
jgi:transposase